MAGPPGGGVGRPLLVFFGIFCVFSIIDAGPQWWSVAGVIAAVVAVVSLAQSSKRGSY